MAEKILKNNRSIRSDCIYGEEDLKPRPGININPPPEDGRCMCCERHISELKPFGKAGDPCVGDFQGVYLGKSFRRPMVYDEEAAFATMEAERRYKSDGYEDPLDWLINKYGKNEGQRLYEVAAIGSTVGKSWECRECIGLDFYEYLERRFQARVKRGDYTEEKFSQVKKELTRRRARYYALCDLAELW